MEYQDANFFELLRAEVRSAGMNMCVPSDEIITRVLGMCECITFTKNTRIIDEGEVNNSLYILKKGLLRISYMEDDREFTLGIASEPSASISPLGFALGLKAHYMITTCNQVEIYRLKKPDFDALIGESFEFARWMLGIAVCQMAMLEFKSQHLAGSAKDQYKSLRKKEYIKKRYQTFKGNFPDVAREVSDRVLASYLGVHPVWLSAIKRELINEERSKKK